MPPQRRDGRDGPAAPSRRRREPAGVGGGAAEPRARPLVRARRPRPCAGGRGDAGAARPRARAGDLCGGGARPRGRARRLALDALELVDDARGAADVITLIPFDDADVQVAAGRIRAANPYRVGVTRCCCCPTSSSWRTAPALLGWAALRVAPDARRDTLARASASGPDDDARSSRSCSRTRGAGGVGPRPRHRHRHRRVARRGRRPPRRRRGARRPRRYARSATACSRSRR